MITGVENFLNNNILLLLAGYELIITKVLCVLSVIYYLGQMSKVHLRILYARGIAVN